ncbi:hypothetical protein H9P43_006890 [Blastocladiella emersonii ATCC 22665]|nr:hypothetical protein H9P43_006890 [Blastocladiella emersonii ATCC 22665]
MQPKLDIPTCPRTTVDLRALGSAVTAGMRKMMLSGDLVHLVLHAVLAPAAPVADERVAPILEAPAAPVAAAPAPATPVPAAPAVPAPVLPAAPALEERDMGHYTELTLSDPGVAAADPAAPATTVPPPAASFAHRLLAATAPGDANQGGSVRVWRHSRDPSSLYVYSRDEQGRTCVAKVASFDRDVPFEYVVGMMEGIGAQGFWSDPNA